MATHCISHADTLLAGPAQQNGANSGKRGVPLTQAVSMNLGTPATASATAVINASAVAGAGAVALTGTVTANAVGQNSCQVLDVPRTLQYVSSNAGDTTQTVTVKGFDQYEQPMTETASLNGTTIVHGKKAFAYVLSVTASAALAGNLSVGTDTKLGLPYVYADVTQLIQAWGAGATDLDTTKFTLADTTSPATASTGDVRGLYNPTTAPNGSRKYVVKMNYYDLAANVNGTQYTGVYGVAQV